MSRRGHDAGRIPNEVDEVELSLLGEEERRAAAAGLTLEEEEYLGQADGKKPFSARDKQAIVLLVILCTCQKICHVFKRPFDVSAFVSREDLIQGFPVSVSLV